MPGDAVAAAVAEDLDASCRLPAECAGTLPQLVVGTLDINQGQLSLPTCHDHLQPSARCTDCDSCGWRLVRPDVSLHIRCWIFGIQPRRCRSASDETLTGRH